MPKRPEGYENKPTRTFSGPRDPDWKDFGDKVKAEGASMSRSQALGVMIYKYRTDKKFREQITRIYQESPRF